MAEFVEVAPLDKVPVGTSNSFMVAGKQIALFNVDGTIYAILDSCLHNGAALSAGRFKGKIVTCRLHGWRYDVTTGNTLNVPDFGVPSYATKVEDGKILVAVG